MRAARVDVVAENVTVVGVDLAEVDADAEFESPAFFQVGLPCRHGALDFGRTVQSVSGVVEHRKYAIAGALDDAAAVTLNSRFDDFAEQRFQATEGAGFIGLRET